MFFAKVSRFEHQKQQEIDKITRPETTEDSYTDKLMKTVTQIKHVTDRKKSYHHVKKKKQKETKVFRYRMTSYNNTTG